MDWIPWVFDGVSDSHACDIAFKLPYCKCADLVGDIKSYGESYKATREEWARFDNKVVTISPIDSNYIERKIKENV